jgi:uncharacterized membrane protein YphA (DoxX/SURF4 family)/thiol-disulfide isomerase/thioredoxin
MEYAALGVRLLLTAVFLVAAVGKLRDLPGFCRTLVAFGAPTTLARGLAVPVVLAELVTAALLVTAPFARLGAALGLILLAAFTTAIAANLGRGRTPDCRCFGQMTPAPIGPATLVRNGVIGVCAIWLLVGGAGPDLAAVTRLVEASPTERSIALAAFALVASLAGLAWLAGRLHDQHEILSRRVVALEEAQAALPAEAPSAGAVGLTMGSQAPVFDLPLLAGDRASLSTLTASGVPVLLIFSSSHCPSCAELWPDIGRWQRDLPKALTVMVVGTGSATAIEMKLMGTEVRDVLLADGVDLAEAYRVAGIPSAVVVSSKGTIDSDTVLGPAAVRALVEERTGVGTR